MKLLTPRETRAWLRSLAEHRRNSRSSREQIEGNQQRKFRELVEFARHRSPFYRDMIAQLHIDPANCSVDDFPVLTKHDVIEHFDRIVTDSRITRRRVEQFLEQSTDPTELLDGEFHVVHTSGTSGAVGYYVFSHDAWIKGSSHVVRVSPLSLCRKRIAYISVIHGHFAGVSLMLTGNHGTNNLFYNVRPFDVNMPIAPLLESLTEFQPHVLAGPAGVLKILAEAQEAGRLCIRPVFVSNGGEPLTAVTKDYLTRVFRAPVSSIYASSEHLYMGLQFPDSDGMYLLEDDLIFELHSDHTCVTNLFNYSMPLIRYRMDDVLVPDEANDGRFPFTKVKELVGRSEEAPVFTNQHGEDDFIHPFMILEFFVRGLLAWQIVCLGKTSFVFRAQYEPSLSDQEKQAARRGIFERMRSILVQKEMENVTFEVEEVDALQVDPRSGKFRMIMTDYLESGLCA
jgi:phenylacetate-coenzyme A ligase PaaK-like adenylate-forming protein